MSAPPPPPPLPPSPPSLSSSSELPELSSDADAESKAAWAKRYDSRECSICTHEYKDGEHLLLTQPCGHVFHCTCLDSWAVTCFEKGEQALSCPVCRQAVQTVRHFATRTRIVTECSMLFFAEADDPKFF